MRKELEEITRLFLIPRKNIKLIDFGCGDMPYRELLSPHVEEYLGLDLAENPLADLHISPNGKIDVEDNSVDVVLSTQVLEHVEDPIEYLSESHRILKPGGILVLSTHGYWIYHPSPTDYWRWTASGLHKILTERGFTVRYFKGIVGRAATGLLLIQDSIIFKLPKFLVPIIAFPIQLGMFICDHIVSSQRSRNKDAAIYIVVCEAIE